MNLSRRQYQIVTALVVTILFSILQVNLWDTASQMTVTWQDGYPTYHWSVALARVAIWFEVLFIGVSTAFFTAHCAVWFISERMEQKQSRS